MLQEEKKVSLAYKEEYLSGLEKFIASREKECAAERKEYIKDIFNDTEKYRADFRKMLGYPLVGYEKTSLAKVKEEKLGENNGHSIVRMSFEILPELWMTGLLFKKNDNVKRPMVIVQHGGEGTPEHIAGFYGSTNNYNDMLPRVIKYDVNAFAPQLLLWSHPKYELTYERHRLDAALKRLGSSITAVEIFGIERIIDYFEQQPYVKNFGMVGLSYGGFYTLFTTAADTRILSAVSSCFFNNRENFRWTDWTWTDAAKKFFDPEVACLIYPRHITIEVGKNDPLITFEGASKEFERLQKLTDELSKDKLSDWLRFEPFEGVHEFGKSNDKLERLINDLT